MRTTLEREYEFEAAHHLPMVPEGHKCHRTHGHSYRVTVVVEGEVDEKLGWLIDFGDIDRVVDPIIFELDHHLLNDLDGLSNPTSEILAAWIWRRLSPVLDELKELRVSETPTSRCIYRGG